MKIKIFLSYYYLLLLESFDHNLFSIEMASGTYDHLESIVLDNGSGSIKIGFAGDDIPKSVFPNVIGHSRHMSTLSKTTTQIESFIGNKALESKYILNLRYPIEHGIVTNWNDMEEIWHYLFHHELGLSTIDRSVLVSEPPLNPMGNREKMTQILFERFQVPGKQFVICVSLHCINIF